MSEAVTIDPLPVPYEAIARLMTQRSVTLFLGAAASLVMATPNQLPDGQQLGRDLSRLANYPGKDVDPLTKVAQYLVEFAADRDLALNYIKSRFHDQIPENYQCSLTDFLNQIPKFYIPKLIVSTNYDTLVERILERQSIPYICISHVLGRSKFAGRLIVYDRLRTFSRKDILTRAEAEEVLQDASFSGADPIILYKMHGSATSYVPRQDRDESFGETLNSVVITEQDYIEFLDRNTMQRLPIQLQKLLLRAQFLFLGYSLNDWNFRLLLHRLREAQPSSDTKHWACLLNSDPVESVFWQKRGVNIHHVSLDVFLENIKNILIGNPQ